jgi:hypothetical protein
MWACAHVWRACELESMCADLIMLERSEQMSSVRESMGRERAVRMSGMAL